MRAPSPSSSAERADWLRLWRSDNVGPVTFRQLLARFGSASAALAALPDLARRGGRRDIRVPPAAEIVRELEAHAAIGARLLTLPDPEFPAALAAAEDGPPVLSVRGRVELLARAGIGMVGARNASGNGVRFARQLAADLGAEGWVVTSGLARGIDAAAHQGALATGTVAVVAGGADVVYPPENRELTARIAAEGAVVSEMPPGLVPQARHFPRRNRLISGLSLGVVVVEAALRSGSLITARFALEQGREVFAVPGSPLDPRCRGTNDLIRQGATLVEGAADVVAVLDPARPRPLAEAPEALPPPPPGGGEDTDTARAQVLRALGPAPLPVDEIARQCQVAVPAVWAVLLELDLAGRLARHPGNQVSLLSDQ